MLAGQVGIAGSTRIGGRVTLAGQVGVAGHLHDRRRRDRHRPDRDPELRGPGPRLGLSRHRQPRVAEGQRRVRPPAGIAEAPARAGAPRRRQAFGIATGRRALMLRSRGLDARQSVVASQAATSTSNRPGNHRPIHARTLSDVAGRGIAERPAGREPPHSRRRKHEKAPNQ